MEFRFRLLLPRGASGAAAPQGSKNFQDGRSFSQTPVTRLGVELRSNRLEHIAPSRPGEAEKRAEPKTSKSRPKRARNSEVPGWPGRLKKSTGRLHVKAVVQQAAPAAPDAPEPKEPAPTSATAAASPAEDPLDANTDEQGPDSVKSEAFSC